MIILKQKIMKAVLNFIDAWGVRIMFFLVVITFFKTCNTNSKVQDVNDSVGSYIISCRDFNISRSFVV